MKYNMTIDFFELTQEIIHEERKIDEILEELKEDGEALVAFFQEIASEIQDKEYELGCYDEYDDEDVYEECNTSGYEVELLIKALRITYNFIKSVDETFVQEMQEIAERYEQEHRVPRTKKVIEPTPKEQLDILYEQINDSLDKYEKETFHQLVAKKDELVKQYPFLAIFISKN